MAGLREWLEDHAIPVLQCILSQMDAEVNDDLSYWRARIEFQMCYALSRARIRQLFDIILEYPHSEPVLGDIDVGLVQTDLVRRNVHALCFSFSFLVYSSMPREYSL